MRDGGVPLLINTIRSHMSSFNDSPPPEYSVSDHSDPNEPSFKKGPGNKGGKVGKDGKSFGKADAALRSMPLNADAERAGDRAVRGRRRGPRSSTVGLDPAPWALIQL